MLQLHQLMPLPLGQDGVVHCPPVGLFDLFCLLSLLIPSIALFSLHELGIGLGRLTQQDLRQLEAHVRGEGANLEQDLKVSHSLHLKPGNGRELEVDLVWRDVEDPGVHIPPSGSACITCALWWRRASGSPRSLSS